MRALRAGRPACRARAAASSPRCDAPLLFDPGERWEYGISIDWVGRLVEAVSGQTLDAYLREHIFAPLGMSDTGYLLTRRAARRGSRNVHQRARRRHARADR